MVYNDASAQTAFALWFGTNLRGIIDAIDAGKLDATTTGCFFSARYMVSKGGGSWPETLTLSKRDVRKIHSVCRYGCATELKRYNVDVVMAGYMRKVGVPILNTFLNRASNLHPALRQKASVVHMLFRMRMYGVKVTNAAHQQMLITTAALLLLSATSC